MKTITIDDNSSILDLMRFFMNNHQNITFVYVSVDRQRLSVNNKTVIIMTLNNLEKNNKCVL